MRNSYDGFSPFYRELISTTGHLQNEIDLVRSILSKYSITKDASIIDAACGTGDIVSYLLTQGYSNSLGLDFSKGMLTQAAEIVPKEKLFHSAWKELHLMPSLLQKFDLALVLSLSLLHSEKADLHTNLSNLHDILKSGGLLVFDNRKWKVISNNLVEPDRPIEHLRFLQEIAFNDSHFTVYDICSYHKDVQTILYDVYRAGVQQKEVCVEVNYLIKTTTEYIDILKNVGFDVIGSYSFPQWPYEIICAKKL